MDEGGVRFDWYQATIQGIPDDRAAKHLALSLNAEQVRVKGRNGYQEAVDLVRDGESLATVFGRSARLGEVHVLSTSSACDEVVPLVRKFWPQHAVSRADAAIDFVAEFAPLDQVVVAFAQERGVKHRLMTDSDGGATRYVGSRKSEVSARLYKKTEEMRAMHPEKAGAIPDGLVRAEVVVRPGKPAIKEAAATTTPADFWGFARWSAALALAILGFEAERTVTHFRRESDAERALRALEMQYRPTVTRLREEMGDERARAAVMAALWVEEEAGA